jgi:spermidine synthase
VPALDAAAPKPAALAVLLALFTASGAAALIYQIVWFQQLSLAIGSSALSLGVLLATFMGGMSLGSLLASRAAVRSPLRAYAAIELAIGALGLAALAAIPLLGGAYAALAGGGALSLGLRLAIAALALLPATLLMGATLPVVAGWLRTEARAAAWLGWCYAANTAGGVLGCIGAGFYLLRMHDARTATFVAVALNLATAAIAAVLARRAEAGSPAPTPAAAARAHGTTPVYVAAALSTCPRPRTRSSRHTSAARSPRAVAPGRPS